MTSPDLPLTGLLTAAHQWRQVTAGESGALVMQHCAEPRFAKLVPAADEDALVAERDRIDWLSGTGVPGPLVLDWQTNENGACLITSAVPGRPADRLDPVELARSWPEIVETLAQLHRLDVAACPHTRTLDDMMVLARATVTEGRVQSEFLPEPLLGTPPQMILAGLEREVPVRRTQEHTEAVICHGDLCLPNVIIDPETSRVSGLIDLGRLGRADPYADIALLLASARETWPDETAAQRADHDLAARYGISLDLSRLDFYLRLDPLTW